MEVTTEQNVREIIEDYNRRELADRLRPAVGKPPPMLAKTAPVNPTEPERPWWRRVLPTLR